MKEKGLIFDIQSFSTHDGPGCRTNIFFTGCPLQCRWCANPESWKMRPHLMFAESTCKWENGCQLCLKHCKNGAITIDEKGKPNLNWDMCNICTTFDCTKICPSGSFKQCVREHSVDSLMKIIRRDMNNWGAEGGVTFTGGEPLLHKDFLIEVLKKCKTMGIHTAIETSAYASEEIFLSVLKYIDFTFIDVKNMDDIKHIEGTRVSNKQILSNIAALKKSGWKGRLVLRQPMINGYNDSFENAEHLIGFMKENNLHELNLLKFHRMGTTKWNQLGKHYAYEEKGCGDVNDEKMQELQALYLDNMIACYIGDNTPF